MRQSIVICALSMFFAANARADRYHENNYLRGFDAARLGGAYTAISTDPSGLVYNPAGVSLEGQKLRTISISIVRASRYMIKPSHADEENFSL